MLTSPNKSLTSAIITCLKEQAKEALIASTTTHRSHKKFKQAELILITTLESEIRLARKTVDQHQQESDSTAKLLERIKIERLTEQLRVQICEKRNAIRRILP